MCILFSPLAECRRCTERSVLVVAGGTLRHRVRLSAGRNAFPLADERHPIVRTRRVVPCLLSLPPVRARIRNRRSRPSRLLGLVSTGAVLRVRLRMGVARLLRVLRVLLRLVLRVLRLLVRTLEADPLSRVVVELQRRGVRGVAAVPQPRVRGRDGAAVRGRQRRRRRQRRRGVRLGEGRAARAARLRLGRGGAAEPAAAGGGRAARLLLPRGGGADGRRVRRDAVLLRLVVGQVGEVDKLLGVHPLRARRHQLRRRLRRLLRRRRLVVAAAAAAALPLLRRLLAPVAGRHDLGPPHAVARRPLCGRRPLRLLPLVAGRRVLRGRARHDVRRQVGADQDVALGTGLVVAHAGHDGVPELLRRVVRDGLPCGAVHRDLVRVVERPRTHRVLEVLAIDAQGALVVRRLHGVVRRAHRLVALQVHLLAEVLPELRVGGELELLHVR
eukprot:Rhum_TRINITY_DN2741_c0_g1::Rhum_TRINITY_DN2741_c0_g1_i1::g.8160::m.8160